MTPQQAGGVLGRLVLAFPAAKTNEGTMTLYLDVLRALPFARAEAACRELTLTQTFLPSLAEIVRACGVSQETLEDGQRATAQLAEAIRRGVELVPDLGSSTRWAVGRAIRPLPLVTDEMPALPSAPVSDEQAAAVRGMLATLGGGMSS